MQLRRLVQPSRFFSAQSTNQESDPGIRHPGWFHLGATWEDNQSRVEGGDQFSDKTRRALNNALGGELANCHLVLLIKAKTIENADECLFFSLRKEIEITTVLYQIVLQCVLYIQHIRPLNLISWATTPPLRIWFLAYSPFSVWSFLSSPHLYLHFRVCRSSPKANMMGHHRPVFLGDHSSRFRGW